MMYRLTGTIQHYTWGGHSFIPDLLGVNNTSQQPCAEYWMGAHPSASSVVELDTHNPVPLHTLIEKNPQQWLGANTADRFGGLPYLFKVLDVRDMLSIQVHPTKSGAEKGFAEENAAGIPVNAANRNYKDNNHKPELMLALSEFWLLHGFKTKELLLQTLNQTQGLKCLVPLFEKQGYYGLYKYVMELPQKSVDEILIPVLSDAHKLDLSGALTKSDPGYWVCKLLPPQDDDLHDLDRGIFSIYFFNLLHLHPGQAIFQGAGVPHAYLEGQNIELMSNSDNVLRGGLTRKHIDVPELLKHTRFEGVVPQIMQGEKNGAETQYPCPVPDFELSTIAVTAGQAYTHQSFSAEILLVAEGEAVISSASGTLSLQKGQSVFIGAAENYSIHTTTRSRLYKAAVPAKN